VSIELKRKPKNVRMHIYIPADTAGKLARLKHELKMSYGDIIAQLVEKAEAKHA
jgi:hypothetical protein